MLGPQYAALLPGTGECEQSGEGEPMITADTVNRIIQFQGDGLPVVSLYVPIDPGISQSDVHSRVTSLVDQIDGLAKDRDLQHEPRLSLRGDIDRIKERMSEEVWQPKGLAVFSCSGRGLYEEVSLPRAVHGRIVVDGAAFVRPMLAILDEYHRGCVVVVDKEWARAWELYDDEMRELTRFKDRLGKFDNYAGGDPDRIRNELSKRHYRRVVQVLDEVFRTERYDLLVIGGHDFEIPAFLEFLPRELRDRFAGSFSIDPPTATAAEVHTGADTILRRYESDQEQKTVAEVLDRAAAGGLAAVGFPACLWAGSVAAVQTLLVQEGVTAAGVVCDDSGWLALDGDTCPICGKPTRHTPDVIDELVQTVIDEGGSIEHVEGDTPLREHAVAATLRFPLPPANTAGP
jgi:peptide subunit release factor 1 (eRF1)